MQDMPGTLAELEGSNLRSFALARLERVASRLADPRVQEIPAWENLARRATAMAISDCVALGFADETLPVLVAALGYLPAAADSHLVAAAG